MTMGAAPAVDTPTPPGLSAEESAAYEVLAPALCERFLTGANGNDVATQLAEQFPGCTWFGMGVLLEGGKKLLLSGNLMEAKASMRLTMANMHSATRGTGSANSSNGGAGPPVSSPAKYEALGDGSLLCVPLRKPAELEVSDTAASCNGSGKTSVEEVLRVKGTLGVTRHTCSVGVLALAVAGGQKLDASLSRLVALSAHIDQRVAEQRYRAKVAKLAPQAARSPPPDPRIIAAASEAIAAGNSSTFGGAGDPVLPEGNGAAAGGPGNGADAGDSASSSAFGGLYQSADGQLEARLLSLLQGLPVASSLPAPSARIAAGVAGSALASSASVLTQRHQQQQALVGSGMVGGHYGRGTPPPPCTSPEIRQLLNEILEAGGAYGDDPYAWGAGSDSYLSGRNSSSGALATAAQVAQQPATIVLPGPDDVKGALHLLRPEDRWFEQHWLWLNFRDPELEKRFNWWHNRQCVKLDSGFCWFSFALLVALLTVDPYSLARYHPNAFPLAFLIVPGVYILHRWDTDWYIKRRHAVIMVQATYYMVYMAIFVTPVFLQVKSPHSLRRPLWLLRVTGVECMLLQLCFQVPFEKFFWMGILHLGIVSSLQRSVCETLYPEVYPARCASALTGLQLLLGFGLAMMVSRYVENWRRRSFLKHVRAERPDPNAVPPPAPANAGGVERGRKGGRNARKALKEAARELEAATLPAPGGSSNNRGYNRA